MGKTYKLNKSELTRLKQEEKIYEQFLPVLKLKQEQLQIEHIRIKKNFLLIESFYSKKKKNILRNASVFPDISNPYKINKILYPEKISISNKSLAGVFIPVLKKIEFKECLINFFDSPCWFILIIDDFKDLILKNIEIQIVRKQYQLIGKELKKATQKVNLFEKVLIPDTKQAIKKINIILGDEQVAAVGRAKIAKNKNITVS
jgi:V/A-type H+-transporting ATPase subunit D